MPYIKLNEDMIELFFREYYDSWEKNLGWEFNRYVEYRMQGLKLNISHHWKERGME